jgi:hypothetical protein
MDNELDYMISLDLGKNGAFTYWNGLEIQSILGWDISNREVFPSITLGMYTILSDVFDRMKTTRCTVVVEKPARHLAYQWVMYEELSESVKRLRVPFVTYMTTSIKKTVTGYGTASKELIQEVVKKSIGDKKILVPVSFIEFIDTEHKWDSIAAGMCYFKNTGRLK